MTADQLLPHACPDMVRAVEDSRVQLSYYPKFREYGVLVAGGSSFIEIAYCPWCGVELPKSLRELFFENLDAMDATGPEDPRIPREYRTDAWWRDREID